MLHNHAPLLAATLKHTQQETEIRDILRMADWSMFKDLTAPGTVQVYDDFMKSSDSKSPVSSKHMELAKKYQKKAYEYKDMFSKVPGDAKNHLLYGCERTRRPSVDIASVMNNLDLGEQLGEFKPLKKEMIERMRAYFTGMDRERRQSLRTKPEGDQLIQELENSFRSLLNFSAQQRMTYPAA
ncbi:hypothetical protein XPA_006974 [Xanthoria parietina]